MRERLLAAWSNVRAIAYREALVLRHDRAFLAVVTMQPIMMTLLFGLVLSNEPRDVTWALLDRSQTAAARRLVAEISSTRYFVAPRPVASYDEGRDLLRTGTVLAMVVIPDRFAADLEGGRGEMQVLLDGSDPLSAARVGGYLTQIAATFEARPAVQPSRRPPGPPGPPGPIVVRQRFWFNSTLRDRDFFLASLAGMLLTNLCLSVTAQGLVGERETGTYEQMLSLPTSALEIVIGKMLPYIGVAYGLLLFALGAAGFGFGFWPRGSFLTLLAVTLPFVLASLAIGVFVSALSRSTAQAVFISVFFILPSFVLSGSMYPYQLMPHGVRELGGLFPLRWYQIALRRIIERGAGPFEVLGPAFALVTLFAVLLGLIRWRMRPRLG